MNDHSLAQYMLDLKSWSIHTWLPPEDRPVGIVFQDYALFPHLRIWQNIAFGLHHLPRKQRRHRALELLDYCHVSELAERYPHQCSGGQQQRIALARTLAREPEVVCLDEPFSGLDSNLRQELREHSIDLLRQHGSTIILVTHDPDEALSTADQVIVMQQGRIAQAGSPELIGHSQPQPRSAPSLPPVTACLASPRTVSCNTP